MSNPKTQKNKPILIWLTFIVPFSFIFGYAPMVLGIYPEYESSKAILAAVIFVGIPLIILIISKYTEISIGKNGFSIKREVDNIRNAVYANQMIRQEGNYYWIDENNFARKVPDKDTAYFLARNKGIIPANQFELNISPNDMPSIRDSAIPMHNSRQDIFVLYDNKLFYQSGLAWIYKIAAMRRLNFTQGNIYNIVKANGDPLVEQIKDEDFENYEPVN